MTSQNKLHEIKSVPYNIPLTHIDMHWANAKAVSILEQPCVTN